MPSVNIQHCLNSFTSEVQNSLDLANDAQHFRILKPGGRFEHIGIRRVELFAGIALLKMHMAWETFLEDVFIRYLCGASSPTGYTPVLLGPPKSNTNMAFSLLLGPNHVYLNWTLQSTLKRAIGYFLYGEPFTSAMNSVSTTLDDISIIRNSMAHRSAFARSNFRTVVVREFGFVPRGLNANRFLLMVS